MTQRLLNKIFFPFTLLLLTGCSNLFYYPSRGLHVDPGRYGQKPQEIWLEADDKTKLFAWYFDADPKKKPQALFVLFHGNAENLSSHYLSLLWILSQGMDYIIFDYRGYGRSEGELSQAGTVADGKAALRWAWAKSRELQTPLVVFGQSLGGTIALESLREVKAEGIRPAAIVIDSSFASYQSIGRQVLSRNFLTWPFQWLAYLLVSDAHAPGENVKDLAPIPTLVMHGDKDKVVEFKMGENLYSYLGDPKEFLRIENGEHTDGLHRENGRYRKAFLEFLSRHAGIKSSDANAVRPATPQDH